MAEIENSDSNTMKCRISYASNHSENCSYSQSDMGGSEDSILIWPWQVRITTARHTCGGTVISPKYILTAAHCFEKNIKVSIGEDKCNDKNERMILQAARVYVHPKYVTKENDIALLELKNDEIDLNQISNNLVCLPDKYENVPLEKICYISGWSSIYDFNGTYGLQCVLQKMCLKDNDGRACDYQLHDDDLVWVHTYGSSPCHEDPRSPMSCKINGIWKIIGITIMGDECGEKDTYNMAGIYVDVRNYIEWINTIILR
ncbi:unnamed protein product [Gordionus sp. m RMFG-2023]